MRLLRETVTVGLLILSQDFLLAVHIANEYYRDKNEKFSKNLPTIVDRLCG